MSASTSAVASANLARSATTAIRPRRSTCPSTMVASRSVTHSGSARPVPVSV